MPTSSGPSPGSLAAVAASSPATPHTAAVEQVPQWLFAFDAAGISCFRALALLSTHPRELAAVRAELADRDLDTPAMLQTLRAALLEAVRLWPTTPAILRETTTATELGGRTLPSDTLVAIIAPLFHRDRERYTWADDFTPQLWAGAASPRAALVPFSEGPAVCAGQNLVLSDQHAPGRIAPRPRSSCDVPPADPPRPAASGHP